MPSGLPSGYLGFRSISKECLKPKNFYKSIKQFLIAKMANSHHTAIELAQPQQQQSIMPKASWSVKIRRVPTLHPLKGGNLSKTFINFS